MWEYGFKFVCLRTISGTKQCVCVRVCVCVCVCVWCVGGGGLSSKKGGGGVLTPIRARYCTRIATHVVFSRPRRHGNDGIS